MLLLVVTLTVVHTCSVIGSSTSNVRYDNMHDLVGLTAMLWMITMKVTHNASGLVING